MLKRDHQDTEQEEKQRNRSLGRDIAYTVGSFLVGSGWGGIAGGFGSFAIPSSVRSELSEEHREEMKLELCDSGWMLRDKVKNWSFHIGRLAVKYTLETAAMYKMVEDIANRGDITWGWLAIPNVIAGIYEYRRHRKAKKASQ